MIKKAYIEVIALLEANKNKKVSTILEDVKALCEAKNSGGSEIGTTFLKDENEETIAIFCYYFKKWMPLSEVVFGKKANTASGYNTMCKEGVSNWTKQQRIAKNEKENLLNDLSEGTIQVEDLGTLKEAIEVGRKMIVESTQDMYHFETSDSVLGYIASEQEAIEVE